MRRFVSPQQKIGAIAEHIAEQYLLKQNFRIIERNFTVSGGEIDIIANKEGVTYFFEVKSTQTNLPVSRETNTNTSNLNEYAYNPVQNVTSQKIHRIQKAIHAFHMKQPNKNPYKIQIIGVWFDPQTKIAITRLFDL